jgi:RNA polymerase sigma factor (sigma-70 family)
MSPATLASPTGPLANRSTRLWRCTDKVESAVASRDLVASARGGDATALTLLLEPLWEPAYRLAFSMLREREAAEDAVQEAALKALQNVRKLRSDTESLRPWFFTIVANQCRSTRRNRWWGVLRLAELPSSKSPENALSEERMDLAQALRQISAEQRLALALRYYLDLPMDEVADVLGISLAAAKSRVRRALMALAPVLGAGGQEK